MPIHKQHMYTLTLDAVASTPLLTYNELGKNNKKKQLETESSFPQCNVVLPSLVPPCTLLPVKSSIPNFFEIGHPPPDLRCPPDETKPFLVYSSFELSE
jgi:hypothetical protein